jgi:di/tricarboxylate transporter
VSRVLWGAIALDGVIMIFLLLLYLPANRALSSVAWPTEPSSWLTRPSSGCGASCSPHGGLHHRAIGYEGAPLVGFAPDLVRELPFVTNSVVKVSTLAMLCGYVAQALRPRMALVGPIIAVHFVSVVAQAITCC